MKLQGRRALITGASQGFGLAVARAFVGEGARVLVCGRDADSLDRAQEELRGTAEKKDVVAIQADVSVENDCRRLADEATVRFGGLDVLVCNAGVHGPKGPIEEVDWGEWTYAVAVNLLGTVQCCRAVLPMMKSQKRGKIILLSGGGATKPMPFLSAYAATKAGVVRFGETLAEEVVAWGIDVNAVAPGALNTRLLDDILEAGPQKVGAEFYEQKVKQKRRGGAAMEHGTALCVFLASEESDGITGRLISAVWDPWRSLAERRGALNASDIYTLRRIVPTDRGQNWD